MFKILLFFPILFGTCFTSFTAYSQDWEQVYPPLKGRISDLAILDENNFVGIGQNGLIARSIDEGKTWQPITQIKKY